MAIKLKDTISANATTATTLQTARTINGTSFNGSANITTANWGTSRTLTIGNTSKAVNGSGNISWSLSEIGAIAAISDGSYWGMALPDKSTSNWIRTTVNGIIPYKSNSSGSSSLGTSSWPFSTIYGVTLYEGGQSLANKYATKSHTHSYAPTSTGNSITIHADSDASSTSEYLLLKAGHNELKVASSAGGTTSTKGQDKLTFNGNIVYHAGRKPTASEIGAATTSKVESVEMSLLDLEANVALKNHTHSYLPLSGGTLTGNFNYNMHGRNGSVLNVFKGDVNGHHIRLGGGGCTIVGAGESGASLESLVGTAEDLHLSADGNIKFYTNCNTIGNRLGVNLDSSLNFYPTTNSKGSVGTSSYKWNSMYANTFYGNVQLPSNGGSWLNGATNGNLKGSKQSTESYHPIISQTTSSNHKISLGGLGDDFGFHVYDANRTANGVDRYWRVSLSGKNVYTDMRFKVLNEWLYTSGNTGWYNESYGGGWYMQDNTWIRSYGNKSLYVGSGTIKTEGTVICNILDDKIGSTNSCYVDNANGGNTQITLRPDVDNKGNLGHKNFTWNYANITSIGNTFSIEPDITYNVTKFNNNDMMYDMVKNMNFYLEKEKSVEEFQEEIDLKTTEEYINADEETQKQMLREIEKTTPVTYYYSKRAKLVANAEELPFEVAPESHVANGSRTIETGAFMTALASALQKAIEKIEILENEIEELINA